MEIKPGKYRHFKGKEYEVIGVALHTETREKLVLYKALYPVTDLDIEFGPDPIFARPKEMFLDKKVIDGKEMPRFERISD